MRKSLFLQAGTPKNIPHASLFGVSFVGVFILAAIVDCLIYTLVRIEHLALMHEVVSFTGVAAIFLGACGAFAVHERTTLDPLFYKQIKREILPRDELEYRYKKRLYRSIYISSSGLLYILFANAFLVGLGEIIRVIQESR